MVQPVIIYTIVLSAYPLFFFIEKEGNASPLFFPVMLRDADCIYTGLNRTSSAYSFALNPGQPSDPLHPAFLRRHSELTHAGEIAEE
jgi:hypothetical protein